MSDGLRALGARTGPVARLAVVLAALGVVVLLFSVRGLGKAVLTPSAQKAKKEASDQIKKVAGEYAVALEGHAKQFNGRSVFFIPSAPVPPPPPAPPDDHKEPPPPPPPPPPSKYEGPKLIAMINGVAWFEDGQKLGAGDAKDKLKVKEVNAPWYTLVEWDHVEFKVKLFETDTVIYPPPKTEEPKDPVKETKATDVKAGEKPETPKPETPKPDAPKPEEPKPADPKPENPQTPKTDPPEAPKPEQPKTDKPDSPGSPEGQIEKHE